MAKNNDGGAAFPRPASEFTASGTCPDGNDPVAAQNGMSLRDWFAGMALQGLLANTSFTQLTANELSSAARNATAVLCYNYADAMLKQRDAV